MKPNYFKSVCVSALALLMLAGCSGEQRIISYDSGTGVSDAEGSPTLFKSSIQATLLLPADPATGACMSAAHEAAFTAAADELGITANTVYGADPENIGAVTEGANVVFGASYDYMNGLDTAAKENSDKLYACFGGYKFNSTNYSNYYTEIYEAQYLAGVAAGTNTVSGKIGIISEYSAEYPDTAAEINSFALGARAANPTAEVIVHTLGSRNDTSNAKSFTEELIAEGCDVISIQCDTSVPADVAAEKNVLFIGYGIDMAADYSTGCLASVVWDLEDYYRSALVSATDGTWASDGNYSGTLAGGAVSLTSPAETSLPVTAARIDSAAALLKGNNFEIFSNEKLVFDSEGKASVSAGAVADNKGNIMISEDGASYFIYNGEALSPVDADSVTSDKLASANMNYLVEGVTVLD